MKRISISFNDDIYEKLAFRKAKTKAHSVAECVRALVNLGLRIEEASAENNPKDQVNEELNAILEVKNLLKNSTALILENTLLSRLVVSKVSNENDEKTLEQLADIKERAKKRTQTIFEETAD